MNYETTTKEVPPAGAITKQNEMMISDQAIYLY